MVEYTLAHDGVSGIENAAPPSSFYRVRWIVARVRRLVLRRSVFVEGECY